MQQPKNDSFSAGVQISVKAGEKREAGGMGRGGDTTATKARKFERTIDEVFTIDEILNKKTEKAK